MFGNLGTKNDFQYGGKMQIHECWELRNVKEQEWIGAQVPGDNYFDMNEGEKRVRIISGEPVGLKVRSVYDI